MLRTRTEKIGRNEKEKLQQFRRMVNARFNPIEITDLNTTQTNCYAHSFATINTHAHVQLFGLHGTHRKLGAKATTRIFRLNKPARVANPNAKKKRFVHFISGSSFLFYCPSKQLTNFSNNFVKVCAVCIQMYAQMDGYFFGFTFFFARRVIWNWPNRAVPSPLLYK